MAIHGVGVARTWRPRAAALFAGLLDSSQLISICVRDTASRDNLERLITDHGLKRSTVDVRMAPDPAFMAAETFELQTSGTDTGRIGLGVTHPAALHAHGDYARVSEHEAILRLAELASSLIASGFRPVLFTNGAFEDEARRNRPRRRRSHNRSQGLTGSSRIACMPISCPTLWAVSRSALRGMPRCTGFSASSGKLPCSSRALVRMRHGRSIVCRTG